MTYDQICKYIFEQQGLDFDKSSNKCRERNLVDTRYMCIYLGRRFTRLSLRRLSGVFGKDHATGLHGIRKVKELYETDRIYRDNFRVYFEHFEAIELAEKNPDYERSFGLLLQGDSF